MEKWKDINGYEGIYQVSNMGRVRSICKRHSSMPRIMKQRKAGAGYAYVGLSLNGVQRKLAVHRLVAKAFVSNTENKPEVNHINGNKTDNCANNLEWVTSKENKIHAHKIGLYDEDARNRSIAVVAVNMKTGDVQEYQSMNAASKATGIIQGSISNSVKYGYQTGGYRFYRRESI